MREAVIAFLVLVVAFCAFKVISNPNGYGSASVVGSFLMYKDFNDFLKNTGDDEYRSSKVKAIMKKYAYDGPVNQGQFLEGENISGRSWHRTGQNFMPGDANHTIIRCKDRIKPDGQRLYWAHVFDEDPENGQMKKHVSILTETKENASAFVNEVMPLIVR